MIPPFTFQLDKPPVNRTINGRVYKIEQRWLNGNRMDFGLPKSLWKVEGLGWIVSSIISDSIHDNHPFFSTPEEAVSYWMMTEE